MSSCPHNEKRLCSSCEMEFLSITMDLSLPAEQWNARTDAVWALAAHSHGIRKADQAVQEIVDCRSAGYVFRRRQETYRLHAKEGERFRESCACEDCKIVSTLLKMHEEDLC